MLLRDSSLSARRAWIEMRKITITVDEGTVALRKESVDRNFYYADKDCDWVRSLSARRAWIEMDRWLAGLKGTLNRRSPQGERG